MFTPPFCFSWQSAPSSSVISLQVGPDGRLAYDMVVRHGSQKAVVYTRPESAHGLHMKDPEAAAEAAAARELPSKEEEEKELQKTKNAIEKELERKSNAGRAQPQHREAEFVRYTPAKLVRAAHAFLSACIYSHMALSIPDASNHERPYVCFGRVKATTAAVHSAFFV